MFIIVKNDVVVATSSSATIVREGIRLDDCVLCVACDDNGNFVETVPDIIEVESLPEDFKAGKYCYTEQNGFYPNPSYRDYTGDLADLKEQLQKANAEIELLKLALDEVILNGGGING